MIVRAAFAAAALLAAPALAAAQEPPTQAAAAPAPAAFVTRHTGVFNGVSVDYVATVGETVLKDGVGAPTLRLVTTSYVRQGQDPAKRPVLFVFNGGPSSSSVTLHMVGLGPKRMVVAQDVTQPIPTPALVDNPRTVLDVADLVFIDPAETGFSRVLAAGKREDFYTTTGDAQSVSRFIEAWLAANGRAASPRYVLGESYGTIRAALMAGQLAKTTPLDGVFLFGQAVNMVETAQREKNAVGYASNLTALAAIAAYHGRADRKGKSMSAFIDEAYAWGMGEYLQALIQGGDLPDARRRQVAAKLAAFTGVSADYYLAHDLVISKVAFRGELLRDKGLVLGVYDARYTGPAPAPGAPPADPFAKVVTPILPLLRTYMAKDLGVTWPMDAYRASAPGAGDWRYVPSGGAGGPFWDYDYEAQISMAFKANPRFRLFVGTGIYDTSTTVGPARQLVAQSDFPRDRVFLRQYEGGHVAYTSDTALEAFAADIRSMVTGAAPKAP